MSNLVQNVILNDRIAKAKDGEEVANLLKQAGLKVEYLTLRGKEEELKQLEEDREYNLWEISRDRDSRKYSLDQVVMVRATDLFAINHIMSPVTDGQVVSHSCPARDIAYESVILKSLGLTRQKIALDEYGSHDAEILKAEKRFYPILRQYRGTKHYTLNTIVSPNSGGNWNNMPYVYFEKLVHHIDDPNLRHLAPHDTFFQGVVSLSDPTLMLTKSNLANLIKSNDEDINTTLKDTNILLLDDNFTDYGSVADYTKYVLEKIMGCPYYKCSDHGVEIEAGKGVYSTLCDIAKVKGLRLSGDHKSTDSYQQENLHFARNLAEDTYNYLVFVRNNEKFNLTDNQKDCMDYYISDYHDMCEKYGSRVSLDFDETNTPTPSDPSFDKANSYFLQLIDRVERAFIDSEFYENVDIEVLGEETTKYNDEYLKAIRNGAKYKKTRAYKEEVSEI